MKALFILLTVSAFIRLINMLTKKYAYTDLEYTRSLDRYKCFKGETFILTVKVTNKKLLPLSYVEVTEKIPLEFEYDIMDNVEPAPDSFYHKNTMMLLPYQRVIRKYSLKCSRRGRYYFSSVRINVGDFFGLETYSKDYTSPVELIIYPSIKPLNSFLIDCKNPMGDVSVKRWIIDDPNMIIGVREYTTSDPFNRIHWPSSAKSGSLMVKNFDFTAEKRVMVVLNIETSKPFWARIDSERIETVIEAAASISSEVLKSGTASGLATNAMLSGLFANEGNYLPPSCSTGYLSCILESLSRITYNIQQPFEDLMGGIIQSGMQNMVYIIITPVITEELSVLLNKLSNQSKVILITFANQDISLISKSIGIYIIREDGSDIEPV